MHNPYNVAVSGPLGPHAEGFHTELNSLGYRPQASSRQLTLMAHLSRWMQHHNLQPADLQAAAIDIFLADRRDEGYTMWLSTKAVAPLLSFLRSIGAAPKTDIQSPVTALDRFLQEYGGYLRSERGLTSGTIVNYAHTARLFLATQTRIDRSFWSALSATDIIEFILTQNAKNSPRTTQATASALRSLLRFAFTTGLTSIDLVPAVPSIPAWRLTTIPRSISRSEVIALLGSCDRRTTFGRRDYAAMLLMVRLGLRPGEVSALGLDDLDWRAGDLIVRGKGSRSERLPLPPDVGDAMAGWIRRGRPVCDSQQVFTRVRAPHQGLSVGGVGNIVRAAGVRAGVPNAHAHRLRHTAATQMLAAGADLIEIGQVLRHASVLTTSMYAKVDDNRLRPLAQAWPTGAQS